MKVDKFPTLPLQLMKAAMPAETSGNFFHHDLYTRAMSTDMGQVGVALFPSF